jgi:archaellum component FlaC
MTTETELKELKETVAVLVKKVDNMSALLAKRLIETVEPLPDEVEEYQKFQEEKKNGTADLIPWEDP